MPDWAIVGMISILVLVSGVALMRFFRGGTAGVPKGQEGAADPFTTGAVDPFKAGTDERKRMSPGLQLVIAIFLIFMAWAACTATQALD